MRSRRCTSSRSKTLAQPLRRRRPPRPRRPRARAAGRSTTCATRGRPVDLEVDLALAVDRPSRPAGRRRSRSRESPSPRPRGPGARREPQAGPDRSESPPTGFRKRSELRGARPQRRETRGFGTGRCRPSAGIRWWSRAGLNRQPPRCERGALPIELRPHARREIAGPQTVSPRRAVVRIGSSDGPRAVGHACRHDDRHPPHPGAPRFLGQRPSSFSSGPPTSREQHGSRVVLFHAYHLPVEFQQLEGAYLPAGLLGQREGGGRAESLARYAEELRGRGHRGRGGRARGLPATAIVDEVENQNADLVVIGTHGHLGPQAPAAREHRRAGGAEGALPGPDGEAGRSPREPRREPSDRAHSSESRPSTPAGWRRW